MSPAQSIVLLRDPRLAVHATSAEPAWLWSADATRVIWANAVGAAVFGAPSPQALTDRRFAREEPAAAQIARIAGSLSAGAAPRLERLRWFGTDMSRLLMCACSRIAIADHSSAVLVVAKERAGPALSLVERVRRLFEPGDGAVAVFSSEGALIFASPTVRSRLANATSIGALKAEALAEETLQAGNASGQIALGRITLDRIGDKGSTVLIARIDFSSAPAAAASETSAPTNPIAATAPPQPKEAPPPPPSVQTAATASQPSPPATAPATSATPASERRHPLRFVWKMDGDGHFTIDSDDFMTLIGPHTASVLGRPWSEINAALGLDPTGRVEQAIATCNTWSGVIVAWPADASGQRLEVELSGLPIYDRQRQYTGYRGFGVCRDLKALAALTRERMETAPAVSPPSAPTELPRAPIPQPPAPQGREQERPAPHITPVGNVLQFRPAMPANDTRAPALSPVERKTFSDLAQQLSARLRTTEPTLDDAVQADAAEAPSSSDVTDAEARQPPQPAAPGADTRILLDRLPVGVLVYRLDTMLYANRAFLARTGHATLAAFDDAGGLETLFIEPGGTEGKDDGQPLAVSTGQGDPIEGQLLAVPWDGETALALVLLAAPGEPRASALVSAMKNSEAEIRRLKAELQKGHQSPPQLKRLSDATARADLLARIGQDIRNPLNAIAGLVEVMLGERFGPIGNERYREYLADMRRSGDTIASLIGDLNDLTRVEAGKLDLGFAAVNLNDLVQSCVTAIQPLASRARVLIRTSLAQDVPTISADPASLRQIVQNLLSNSIKLADKGGQVIVSTASAGERAILRLRDTGSGMSEQALALALQPPRRSLAAAADPAGALTFAVAKTLAEANRATFAIASKLDEGTLIEIAFPTSMPAA